jgi:hypothetical protein
VAPSKGSSKNLYASETPNGDAYSEFHFGAGEASVIRIIADIETTPDESLILIEEIENGLHPIATRRLVEHLITVAREKSCQIIFTTHSNDALAPLPDEGVWSCSNGSLTQGKLDVTALRTLTGEVKASLAVFVEDSFSHEMVLAALRQYSRSSKIDLLGLAVHPVGGEGNVCKLTRSHNDNPALAFKAVGILDGDVPASVDHAAGITSLPGRTSPEVHVATRIEEIIDERAAKLAVALGLPVSDQGRVREVLQRRLRTNRDAHLLFEQIGEDLDFTAGLTVARAFLAIWAQGFENEVNTIFEPIESMLPRERKQL